MRLTSPVRTAIVAAVAATAFAGTAGAAITQTLDSAAFAWKYEMNAEPSTQNLDASRPNSVNDFTRVVSNGATVTAGTSAVEPTANILTLSTSSMSTSTPDNAFYNSVTNNASTNTDEIWPAENYTGAFTVEARLRIVSQVATSEAVFALQASGFANDVDGLVYVSATGQKYGTLASNGGSIDAPIGGANDNNSAAFHAFRLAYDPDPDPNVAGEAGKFSVWRDGVLLTDANGNSKFGDAFGSLPLDRLIFGDFARTAAGVTELDYVRFTPGAFAPVPEPSSLGLLAVGAAAWCRRR